ncbi:MAG: pknB [Gemmataceae bacterium]|nr:pknB [Gemmataceae bacterium]
MSWSTIDRVRQWAGRRKGLLAGVVGVCVEEAIEQVPGVRLAVKLVDEIARHGVERLVDPGVELPDVKALGQALPMEQLGQINAWLETVVTGYGDLLDKLEALPVRDGSGVEELTALVKQTLLDREDWRAEFDARARDVRRLTLSLGRVEEVLDDHFHVQNAVAMSLEDIKTLLAGSPLLGEYAEFRRARPEAVEALLRADEHFLAGRRERGAAELLDLLRLRGVGQATLCNLVGLRDVCRGDLYRSRIALEGIEGVNRSSAVTRALTGFGTAATRGGGPVWRSLPRDFLVNRKYRVDAEVGRGGMASVYRCVTASQVGAGEVVAVKVPAPGLMVDAKARRLFVQEIEVSQRLSAGRHPAIVQTLGYEVFDDPRSGHELYGLVLEYIDGLTLAQFLAQRRVKNKPLRPEEVVHVLKPVCAALDYAHSQNLCHRDVKPHNVMLARGGIVKLTDFGIARVLENCRAARTAQEDLGTPAYMPPDRDYDVRSDIYLLGNLLLEMLTFDPRGDVEGRPDCPPGWTELVADSMNRVRGKRPASAREFLTRLEAGPTAATAPRPLPPLIPHEPGKDEVKNPNDGLSPERDRIMDRLERMEKSIVQEDSDEVAALIEEVEVELVPPAKTGRPKGRKRAQELRPHRGGLLTTLGLLSFCIPFPLGPIAWVIGNLDLAEIEAGRMDPSGEAATRTGRLCGKLATFFLLCVFLLGCVQSLLLPVLRPTTRPAISSPERPSPPASPTTPPSSAR